MPPETVYAAPPPAPAPIKALPGFSELYNAGKTIYQQHLHTFLKIGAILFVVEFLLTLISPKNGAAPTGHEFTTGVTTGALSILAVWITFVMYFVIAGHAQNVGGKGAFSLAGKKLLSYFWIIILSALTILGISLVVVGIPLLILGLIAVFALHGSEAALIVVAVLAALGFLAVCIYVGVHLAFAPWLLVEGKEKGVAALRASRDMVRGRFGPIFASLFSAGVIAFFIYLPVLVVVFIVGMIGGNGWAWIADAITSAYSALLVVPIATAMKYTIYDRVKS